MRIKDLRSDVKGEEGLGLDFSLETLRVRATIEGAFGGGSGGGGDVCAAE